MYELILDFAEVVVVVDDYAARAGLLPSIISN